MWFCSAHKAFSGRCEGFICSSLGLQVQQGPVLFNMPIVLDEGVMGMFVKCAQVQDGEKPGLQHRLQSCMFWTGGDRTGLLVS